MATELSVEEMWRGLLSGENPDVHRGRHFYGLLPSAFRCKVCNVPFSGISGQLMRFGGKRRSSRNQNFCNVCDEFAQNHKGGTEVVMTMLFAGVRVMQVNYA